MKNSRSDRWSPDQMFTDGKGDGEWGELTTEGYRIRRFCNGKLVGEEIHAVPPDSGMPKMSDKQARAALKATEEG